MPNNMNSSNPPLSLVKPPFYNRTEAKKRLTYLLHTDFNYIFTETWLTPWKLHMSFKMDDRKYDLQMTIDFYDGYCDVLTFINPTVLTKEYYEETLNTVNYINWYVKGAGRFYIDDCLDICYALRLPNSTLEDTPVAAIYEIHGAIYYFEDVFQLLIAVATGKKSFDECRDFINKMWGH